MQASGTLSEQGFRSARAQVRAVLRFGALKRLAVGAGGRDERGDIGDPCWMSSITLGHVVLIGDMLATAVESC